MVYIRNQVKNSFGFVRKKERFHESSVLHAFLVNFVILIEICEEIIVGRVSLFIIIHKIP